MAQTPALVFIARHGTRLDAVSDSWHLSTPTPYDPPLTYGGWNQCRALGQRIAAILHAREQVSENYPEDLSGNAQKKGPEGRKPRRYKLVIHTSPFLGCVQTSVAIAAGLAQFDPPKDGRTGAPRPRTAGTLHSASPRLRAMDGSASPKLAPISEPTSKFAQNYARRLLEDHRRHRKPRLRIDAWLGEWLNPSYFEDITPPPSSPMLLTAAKGGLMRNESIETYTPSASSKSSVSSLWSGTNGKSVNRDHPLDDWSEVGDSLSDSRHRLERSGSVSSIASSGRRSPFRPYGVPTSSKTSPAVYVPPTPTYAVSTSDLIPRGYVTHARDGTLNVDYHWDSSRAPQEWGDGGEYGEEWSAMQKRFRRGLNHLMEWYSLDDPVDRGEDALGLDQAEHHHDDEVQEELVVILVTHGAGSNALIGALTGQPVLLDVGMASLTMAVRKENAPPLSRVASPPAQTSPGPAQTQSDFQYNANRRRSSVDIGLSNIYDMKLVASSEHLRPGTDPTKLPPMMEAHVTDLIPKHKRFRSAAHATAGVESDTDRKREEPVRKNTSTAIGSIRRPSAANVPTRSYSNSGHHVSFSMDEVHLPSPMPQMTPGLWTPPSARQPTYSDIADEDAEHGDFFSAFSHSDQQFGTKNLLQNTLMSQATPPDSDPASPGTDALQSQIDADTAPLTRTRSKSLDDSAAGAHHNGSAAGPPQPKPADSVILSGSGLDGALGYIANGYAHKTETPQSYGDLPSSLRRGLSQKGLWGHGPSGARVARRFAEGPKRRWTLTGEN